MREHPHSEIIKAKIADMELAVLYRRTETNSKWYLKRTNWDTTFDPDVEYFLCPKSRVSLCLHWLNGGDLECRRGGELFRAFRSKREWYPSTFLMNMDLEFRVKKNIEKRWIRTDPSAGFVDPVLYKNKPEEVEGLQTVEIEVEV